MFGRATITLGIGPHSNILFVYIIGWDHIWLCFKKQGEWLIEMMFALDVEAARPRITKNNMEGSNWKRKFRSMDLKNEDVQSFYFAQRTIIIDQLDNDESEHTCSHTHYLSGHFVGECELSSYLNDFLFNLLWKRRQAKHLLNVLLFRKTWVSQHHKDSTNLDFNQARDDGMAVTLAGPYANYLHLAPDR